MPALFHVSMKCATCYSVVLLVKLLEFWRLITTGHVECINPLNVRPSVEVSLMHTSPKLCRDCIYNQVLDLFDGH